MTTKTRMWHPSCIFCNKSFSNSTRILDHLRSHIGEKPHRCEACGYEFVQNSHLKIHQKRFKGHCLEIQGKRSKNGNQNQAKFSCPTCEKSFGTKAHLKRHQLIHKKNKPVFKCDQCPAKFSAPRYLTDHKKIKHEENGQLPVTSICDLCSEVLLHPWLLPDHRLQCHPDVYYKSKRNHVVKRERARVRVREYQLDPKTRLIRLEAKLAKMTQQLEGPGQVEEDEDEGHEDGASEVELGETEHNLDCDVELGSTGQSSETHHEKDGNKKFICPTCNKNFANKQNLNRHKLIHINTERVFKCDQCPLTFPLPRYLKAHQKKHESGKLAITCDLCGEALAHRDLLGPHRLQSHPEHYQKSKRNFVENKQKRKRRQRKSRLRRMEAKLAKMTQELELDDGKGQIGHGHEESHESQFRCNICDEKFENQPDYTEHKKSHVDAEDAAIAGLDLLDDPDHDHDNDEGQKPKKNKQRRKKIKYKCLFCPDVFKGYELLEKHFEEVHKGNVDINSDLEDEDDDPAIVEIEDNHDTEEKENGKRSGSDGKIKI